MSLMCVFVGGFMMQVAITTLPDFESFSVTVFYLSIPIYKRGSCCVYVYIFHDATGNIYRLQTVVLSLPADSCLTSFQLG